jgi:hypothetical protein
MNRHQLHKQLDGMVGYNITVEMKVIYILSLLMRTSNESFNLLLSNRNHSTSSMPVFPLWSSVLPLSHTFLI